MLLICPVRPGDTNEELRYAARSWEQNLALDRGLTLMTVGHHPDWLEPDLHVSGNHYKSVMFAVFDNVVRGSTAALEQFGNDQVLWMNDDFFCLDPVGAVLPVRRNVTLAAHIEQFPPKAGLWWPRSLALTASWLEGKGFSNPLSYEVHRPLVGRPAAMLSALEQWDGGMKDTIPQWRTMDGVLNAIEAHPVVDAKLGPESHGVGTPWVSTSDQSWRRYAVDLRRRFQKPSRWEK